MVAILTRLPEDEDSLFEAFDKNDLAGRPADKYNGWIHIGKFNGFKEFVRGRLQSKIPKRSF